MDYQVADNLATDVIDITRADIKLGSTPITISGTINTRPTPAQIDVKITAANASIAEAARLASAFGVAFNSGMEVSGRVDANVQARGAANQPTMTGQLSARDLNISGKDLPEAVKVDWISVALAPETIHTNDFTARTGQTSVTVNMALAQYTSPNSRGTASLRASQARLGEVLSIAKAYGISAVEGMSGDGLLNADVRVEGPVKKSLCIDFQRYWQDPKCLCENSFPHQAHPGAKF